MIWSLWNPIVYPLIDINNSCSDVRFPFFKGDMLITCFREQFALYDIFSKTIVDTVDHIEATSGDAIWVSGIHGGIYDSQKKEIDHKYRFTQDYVAPPAVSSNGTSFVVQKHAVWLNQGGISTKIEISVAPQSWYAPAISACGPVWIDEQNDIWLYRISKHQKEQVIPNGGFFPRYMTALDAWIFWVEDYSIRGWNCEENELYSIKTQAIDRIAILNVDQKHPMVCWSAWMDDIYGADILCSNQQRLQRENNQLWPSIGDDGKLLFRDENGIFWVQLEEARNK